MTNETEMREAFAEWYCEFYDCENMDYAGPHRDSFDAFKAGCAVRLGKGEAKPVVVGELAKAIYKGVDGDCSELACQDAAQAILSRYNVSSKE